MQPHISVIMPCYNAAPWIGQAVESVLLQEGVAWELLIVDDGSTDASRDIAQGYAAMNGRIRLMNNGKTKGVSGARNTGLENVRGETVFFLDSDDVLLPGALAGLFRAMRSRNLQALRGRGAMFCAKRLWLFEEEPFPPEYAPPLFPAHGFWLYLYDTDFLRRGGVTFPEGCSFGEDCVFLFQTRMLLGEVRAVNTLVNVYRVNHKKYAWPAAQRNSYARRAGICREICRKAGKPELLPAVIEHEFFPLWPAHIHAARQEGEETLLRYLDECVTLFREPEESLKRAFTRTFGPAGKEAFALCAAQNVAGLADLLRENENIIPSSPYMGINRDDRGISWLAYLFARGTLSLLTSRRSRGAFLYLTALRARAARGPHAHEAARKSVIGYPWE